MFVIQFSRSFGRNQFFSSKDIKRLIFIIIQTVLRKPVIFPAVAKELKLKLDLYFVSMRIIALLPTSLEDFLLSSEDWASHDKYWCSKNLGLANSTNFLELPRALPDSSIFNLSNILHQYDDSIIRDVYIVILCRLVLYYAMFQSESKTKCAPLFRFNNRMITGVADEVNWVEVLNCPKEKPKLTLLVHFK